MDSPGYESKKLRDRPVAEDAGEEEVRSYHSIMVSHFK